MYFLLSHSFSFLPHSGGPCNLQSSMSHTKLSKITTANLLKTISENSHFQKVNTNANKSKNKNKRVWEMARTEREQGAKYDLPDKLTDERQK